MSSSAILALFTWTPPIPLHCKIKYMGIGVWKIKSSSQIYHQIIKKLENRDRRRLLAAAENHVKGGGEWTPCSRRTELRLSPVFRPHTQLPRHSGKCSGSALTPFLTFLKADLPAPLETELDGSWGEVASKGFLLSLLSDHSVIVATIIMIVSTISLSIDRGTRWSANVSLFFTSETDTAV